jgi:hypothetical protein
MFPVLPPEVRLLPKALPAAPFTTSSAILPMLFKMSFFIFLSPLVKEGLKRSLLPLKIINLLRCLSFPRRQVIESFVELIDLTLQNLFFVSRKLSLISRIRSHKGVTPSGHTSPAHVAAIYPSVIRNPFQNRAPLV